MQKPSNKVFRTRIWDSQENTGVNLLGNDKDCLVFSSPGPRYQIMEDQICQHHKYGYCKFQMQCQKKHLKGQCEAI